MKRFIEMDIGSEADILTRKDLFRLSTEKRLIDDFNQWVESLGTKLIWLKIPVTVTQSVNSGPMPFCTVGVAEPRPDNIRGCGTAEIDVFAYAYP